MSDYVKEAEHVLLPEAEKYCPAGTDPKAIVHQWLTAAAYGKPLFANYSPKSLFKLLTAQNLYTSQGRLKQTLRLGIKLVPQEEPKFTFIDLFAGIGGFRLALQKYGGISIFSSEWDKGAQNTYLKNYGEKPFGDITSLTGEEINESQLDAMIPYHDILTAGFPCQPFSHAGVSARNSVGKAHGFQCATQGTLFFDVMRIASIKKPKVLFLENVRNIQRHDGGYTFKVIQESIEEIGYDFKYAIIDSSSLVPQRRVRCYMVCFRKDLNIEFNFPKLNNDPIPLKSILEKEADEKYTISDKLWAGHINRTKRNLERGTGFTAFTADINKPSNTLVARYGKDGKECLIAQQGKNPRFLTPRECARLQGFPDEFVIPDAKTPAYKQFGNSVAVPVIDHIAKNIIEALL